MFLETMINLIGLFCNFEFLIWTNEDFFILLSIILSFFYYPVHLTSM